MTEFATLHMGDCLEVLKNLQAASVDMVLTDPPYGIDFQSARIKDKAKRKPKIIGDKETQTTFIPEIARILKPTGAVVIFTRWDVQQKIIDEMTGCGMKPRNVLIWDKVAHGMGDLKRAFGSRYESAVFYSAKDFRFNGKRPTDILKCPRVPANQLRHPNEKPTKLLESLIEPCTIEGGGGAGLLYGQRQHGCGLSKNRPPFYRNRKRPAIFPGRHGTVRNRALQYSQPCGGAEIEHPPEPHSTLLRGFYFVRGRAYPAGQSRSKLKLGI